MRRLLVLGGTGMLGHRVAMAGATAPDVDTWVTVRTADGRDARLPAEVVPPDRVVGGLDAAAPEAEVVARLRALLHEVRPDVVVNCVGVVKQRPEGDDEALIATVNARFPHLVAAEAGAARAALVHLSTDCVFDGTTGGYHEDDPVSATDAYGRSKAAGEPSGPMVCVLRTSMIGRELHGANGLLEWFLAAPDPVPGWAGARFSGLTTPVLADVLVDLARRPEPLVGPFHVAADPIDKATLLELLVPRYRPGTTIVRRDEPVSDRSLDGGRFRAATGFRAPSWPTMVADLAADPTPYDRWRTSWPTP
ncbi:MAG: sugar nucleotide-binding protein [Actinobacteria bacterium]|nr:sugar nucleotide-binding protein [Actinomycetota bacterium]